MGLEVPAELVPAIRELIAKHQQDKKRSSARKGLAQKTVAWRRFRIIGRAAAGRAAVTRVGNGLPTAPPSRPA